ncbi:MAG TPA: LUD domain-containing protein [Anaerolineales bacterium]|nr:LUD domain-containing protein [Anaerolineales bacterium]
MNPFRTHIRKSLADPNLQVALDNNAVRRQAGRRAALAQLPDKDERRQRAHAVKMDVIAHLDRYVDEFAKRVTGNGIRVHRAADAGEAIRIFLEIAGSVRADGHPPLLVAKSKSMVSEEINFNHAMEAQGMRVVETDLGEFIVQLRGERPSHILTPAVHLRKEQVGELFHEKLGIPYTDDIPALTATARKVLREVFLTADIGVSGVNFGVVETGTLCMVTNEGNGRMCTTLPPVHVALMGIERLVPTMDDLALFLSLLPRSGTGQKLSVYTSLLNSPRRPGDADGPAERHLILLDNGRTRMSHSDLAESLACIRCGACLNACPVFREIGGHAYRGADGSIAPYPGPIGSVVSPGLFGLAQFGHLAQASSLCGACKEACPVDIDLPAMLLRLRSGNVGADRGANPGVGLPLPVKLGLKAYRLAARTPFLFAVGQGLGSLFSRLYSPRKPYMRIPAFTGWGYSKDFPRFAGRTFHARWKRIDQRLEQPLPAATTAAVHPSEFTTMIVKKSPSERFTEELTLLGGKVTRVRSLDLPSRLADFLRERNIPSVFVDESGAEYGASLKAAGIAVTREADPAARCGITGAVAGIGETGSVVVSSGSGCPLTASLLPEIYIAILKKSQILHTLTETLRKPEIREASAAAIITGPSRTADIEMALTIGVHGPGEIHAFVIDDSPAV